MERSEKLDYFIDRTDERLTAIELKIEQLISFRMMLFGGAAVISVLAGTITAVIIAFIERG